MAPYGEPLGQSAASTLSGGSPAFLCYIYSRCMEITYDETKRQQALVGRGLDFADAMEVFRGWHMTLPDTRMDYGEDRFATFGFLAGRLVVVVWTKRGNSRRVISMRKANDREKARFGK